VRVTLELGRSPELAAVMVVLHASALAVVLSSPLPPAPALVAVLVLLVSLVAIVRNDCLRTGAHAIVRAQVGADGTLVLVDASGTSSAGVVLPGCYVVPWIVLLRFRLDGRRRAGTLAIVRDAATPDGLRRLRILLRHAGPARRGRRRPVRTV